MRFRRKASLGLASALVVTLLGTSTAHAWYGNTHKELARQAILWMLRSSNRELRMAGVLLMSSGEGMTASATGDRAWPLSDEARDTDIYRDLPLHNKGDAAPALVSYDFAGNAYTKYNHLLLMGPDGMRDVSGCSVDKYTTPPGKTPSPACSKGQRWMGSHDLEGHGGYVVGLDNSLGDLRTLTWDDLKKILASGEIDGKIKPTMLALSGSALFKKMCGLGFDEVESGLFSQFGPELIGITLISAVLFPPLAIGIVTEVALYSVFRDSIRSKFTSICPYMVGIWDFTWTESGTTEIRDHRDNPPYGAPHGDVPWWKIKRTLSPAMIELGALNHSTIDSSDVEGVGTIDQRFHGADNLATRGYVKFADWNHLVSRVRDRYDDSFANAYSSCVEPGVENETYTGIESWTGPKGEIIVRDLPSVGPVQGPYCKGYIPQLGQLIHAITDVDNPGHGSGLLFAPEHELLESDIDKRVGEFSFDTLKEQTSRSGAIEEEYKRSPRITSEPSYDERKELDFLFDTYNAPKKIQDLLRIASDKEAALGPDLQGEVIERLVEKVAQDRAVERDVLAILMRESPGEVFVGENGDQVVDPGKPPVGGIHFDDKYRHEHFTTSMVNAIVGTTVALRMYHRKHEDKKGSGLTWDDRTQRITWTDKDAALVRDGSRFPWPTYGKEIERELKDADARYDLSVDRYYKEYRIGGCYVKNHDWCLPGTLQPCTGDPKEKRGMPEFVDADKVEGEIVLSELNQGSGDDFIHVTGVVDTARVSGTPYVTVTEQRFDFLPGRGMRPYTTTVSVPDPSYTRHLSKDMMAEAYSPPILLNDSKGRVIPLPAGALGFGVATWCTGGDAVNEKKVSDDVPTPDPRKICETSPGSKECEAALGLYRVICDYSQIQVTNADVCEEAELQIWKTRGGLRARLPKPPFQPKKLPFSLKENTLTKRAAESITDLAVRYSAEETVLSTQLASAQGKEVTLLDPSPYGRASFIWKDAKGLRNTTTVLWSGNVVTTKTAK